MDLNDALRRLEAAKGDPSARALATVDIVLGSQPPGVRQALEAAAVPHWFDRQLLGRLLDSDTPEAPDWFDQVARLTVVERFRIHEAWNVHELTRLALRKRLATDHASRFRALSARAASLVEGDETARSIEGVYHRLSSEPDEGANELRQLWKDWSGAARLQPLQALGMALDELCGQQLLTPRARGYALVVIGSIRTDRMELAAWKAMAEEAVELMTQVGDEIGQADAYKFLGRALRTQGRLADALTAFERARESLERHSSANPAYQEAGERADLHLEVGRTAQDRGQPSDALREFEAALAIRLRLSELSPDDEQCLHELAIAHADVGDALGPTSRSGEAESHFLQALQLIETIPGRRMGLEQLQQNAGRLQSRLGDFFVFRGDGDGALKRYEIVLQTFLRLIKGDPEHLGWKRDIAGAHLDMGRVHLDRRHLDLTEQCYAAAREIFADLAERDPANPACKENLGRVCSEFASLRNAQEATSEALQELIEAERLLKEVSEANPDRAESKMSLANAKNGLATFIGRVADAVEDEGEKGQLLVLAANQLLAARKILDELIEQDPGNIRWRRELASSQQFIAAAFVRQAKATMAGVKTDVTMSPMKMLEVALLSYQSSARVFRQLTEEYPENTSYEHDHSVATARAGGVLELLGRPAEALAMYREALDEVAKLSVVDATNAVWASNATYLTEAVKRLEDEQTAGPPS